MTDGAYPAPVDVRAVIRFALDEGGSQSCEREGLRPDAAESAILPVVDAVFDDDSEPSPAVAAERDRIMAPIRDPRLRAHLWSPYFDALWARDKDGIHRTTSAIPFGWESIGKRSTTASIVAWDLAYYDDVSLAVVQTRDRRLNGQPPRS